MTEPTDPIAFMRYYNAWRIGGDMDQPEPSMITRKLTELCDHAERLERELAAERALADRLAALLQHDRDGYGGQAVDPKCDCCDCEYLRPIDEALAAWKASRDQNNLEGPGPSEEERRENSRAISALSVGERFALMFQGKEGGGE